MKLIYITCPNKNRITSIIIIRIVERYILFFERYTCMVDTFFYLFSNYEFFIFFPTDFINIFFSSPSETIRIFLMIDSKGRKKNAKFDWMKMRAERNNLLYVKYVGYSHSSQNKYSLSYRRRQ